MLLALGINTFIRRYIGNVQCT